MSRLFLIIQHLFHPQRSNNHRPRLLHPEFLIYFIFFAFGATFFFKSSILTLTMGDVLGYASDITPVQVISLTNAERSKAGLPQVIVNPTLSAAALAKGQDMFAQQYWAHTSPSGKEPWSFMSEAGYSYRVAGENLARDFDTTGAMVAAWMNSPTHRANIVHPKYTEIGIAVIDGSLQGVETTLVVQMFGTPPTGGNAPIPAIPQVSAAQKAPSFDEVVDSNTSLEHDNSDQKQPEQVNAELTTVVLPQDVQEIVTEPELSLQESQAVPITQQRVTTKRVTSTPTRLLKYFFVAVLLLIMCTLIYDTLIIGHRRRMRVVGDNIGHLLLFFLVLLLVLVFKTGVVL